MKDKNVAGILALFFGWLGIHRFYLGQVGLGILFVFLTVISVGTLAVFFSVIDAIVFFSQEKDAFDLKYNKSYYKAVRRERPDFNRPGRKRNWEEGPYSREKRAAQRSQQRSQRRPQPTRKPRANPYKASGIEKYKEYDYDGSIEDFVKALEIDERDIATHFNIACAFSLTENVEKAYYHLDRAVSLGFNDFRRIKEHDALAYLRIQEDFDAFEENGYKLPKTAPAAAETSSETKPTESTQEEGLELPNDLLEQLNKLNELKNKGLLTEEEFAVQKNKLLK